MQRAIRLANEAGLTDDEIQAIVESLLYQDVSITQRLQLSFQEQEAEERLNTETFMKELDFAETKRLTQARKLFLKEAEADNELGTTVQDEFRDA